MTEPTGEVLAGAIARAVGSFPAIQAAFLFGSHVAGRARADSDIDVAVLLDTDAGLDDARTRIRHVIGALASELAADRLDVVILNDAPPALAFEVLRRGRLAFERDRKALHRFRVATYARHSDFVPVERLFRSVTRRRTLARTARG
jgi:predicted nucleotidyltransferase